jgi:hypothetical protein
MLKKILGLKNYTLLNFLQNQVGKQKGKQGLQGTKLSLFAAVKLLIFEPDTKRTT